MASKVRINRKKRLFLVIFLIIAIGLGWKTDRVLSKNVWDGQNRLNLVFRFQGSSPLIMSFSPETSTILIIPANAFIEVTHGYGPYRAESIYQLGELEKKLGGELLAESVQEYLGIPVDGYIINSNVKTQMSELKEGLMEIFRNSLKGGGKTNLTKWDLLRLWWKIRGVREDKINIIDLKEASASEEIILSDGTKAIKIDPERLERILSQFFVDEKIRQETLTIAVLNGTNHLGLANKGARLIGNMGGRVIGVGDVESSRCEARSEKKYKNSYTVKKLIRVFDCEWGGENLENQRADVVLILGEQYWQKLNQP